MLYNVVNKHGEQLGYIPTEPRHVGRLLKVAIPDEISCAAICDYVAPETINTFTLEKVFSFYVLVEGNDGDVNKFLRRYKESKND